MCGNAAHKEGMGGGAASILAACSSFFICPANVAAVSQWSLWRADDSLAEATGARQSSHDLSAHNVLELHPISPAPPTSPCQLYRDNHLKRCVMFIPGLPSLLRLKAKPISAIFAFLKAAPE